LSAETLDNHASFQGYSGILNTPSAEVMEEYRGEFLFSNQHDFRLSKTPGYRGEDTQNYFLSLGFLPHLEITGRVAERNPSYGNRDLSASLKFQVPFYHRYLPKLAFGVQDIGGKTNYFRSSYVVMSKELWRLRGSLGYGFGPDRLEGLFGGAEMKVNDWVYLLAENDHTDTHLGVRLNTPRRFFDAFSVALYAKTSPGDPAKNYDFGFSVQFDLGKKEASKRVGKRDAAEVVEHEIDAKDKTPEAAVETSHTDLAESFATKAAEHHENALSRLANRLTDFGFENVTVGEKEKTVLIAYENNVLDHNELDGVGVVLHLLLEEKTDYEKVLLVIRKSNMDVASIAFDSLADARSFLEGDTGSRARFRRSVRVSFDVGYDGFALAADRINSSAFKTRIELSPGLKTFVATEYGLIDYLVSLRTYVQWNLYKGVDLDLLYDTPLWWSDDLERDSGRYRYANRGNELQSLMLNNTDRLGSLFNTLSVGKYRSDYLGGFDQLLYQHGRHNVKLELGYFENQELEDDTREVYLASYRYYYPEKDLFFELNGGQYWHQDRGYGVEVKRFFGDTLIGFFFSDTEYDNYAGVTLELPLTPRRVCNSRYAQLKGKKDFSYYLRSTVMQESGTNYINTSGAVIPVIQTDIENDFLNRDRLSQAYVERHLYRIKDAYETIPIGKSR
jgi:hypothetical protein